MKSLKQYLNEALVSRKITKSNCVSIQPDFFDTLDKTKQDYILDYLKYGNLKIGLRQPGIMLPGDAKDLFIHITRFEFNNETTVFLNISDSEDWPPAENFVSVCEFKSWDSKNKVWNLFINKFKEKYDDIIGEYNKDIKENAEQLSDVKTKWHPEEGLFSKDAEYIVAYLRKHSVDDAQAMKRLVFYMNRAGENLQNKTELNKAKKMLEKD